MAFTEKRQLRIIEVLKSWIDERIGGLWVGDLTFRVGTDATQYSEYAGDGYPWMAMDGSILYDLLNDGSADKWAFHTEFNEFLESIGLWYEQGHSWNMSFYPMSSERNTMKKITAYSKKVKVRA